MFKNIKINNDHNAILVLETGDVFFGQSIGKKGFIPDSEYYDRWYPD